MNNTLNAVALAAKVYTPDSELGFGEAIKISITGILVVMFELALLAVCIIIMSKLFKMVAKNKKEEIVPVPANVPAAPKAEAVSVITDEGLVLTGVDEPTAAAIIATICSQTDIPFENLRFKSITLLEDK